MSQLNPTNLVELTVASCFVPNAMHQARYVLNSALQIIGLKPVYADIVNLLQYIYWQFLFLYFYFFLIAKEQIIQIPTKLALPNPVPGTGHTTQL